MDQSMGSPSVTRRTGRSSMRVGALPAGGQGAARSVESLQHGADMPESYRVDPRDIFLRGRSIALKALTEQDVVHSGWYGWFNDEEVTRHMQQHYRPNTLEQQLEFWRELQRSGSKLQLGVVRLESPDKLLGCISLSAIDHVSRKAEIGTVMGEPEGRDIRTYIEANQLLIRHAFETLNLRRIYGGTVMREVADMMCRVIGFRHEGVARQDVYKRGEFHDVYRIGLLREEFKQPK